MSLARVLLSCPRGSEIASHRYLRQIFWFLEDLSPWHSCLFLTCKLPILSKRKQVIELVVHLAHVPEFDCVIEDISVQNLKVIEISSENLIQSRFNG